MNWNKITTVIITCYYTQYCSAVSCTSCRNGRVSQPSAAVEWRTTTTRFHWNNQVTNDSVPCLITLRNESISLAFRLQFFMGFLSSLEQHRPWLFGLTTNRHKLRNLHCVLRFGTYCYFIMNSLTTVNILLVFSDKWFSSDSVIFCVPALSAFGSILFVVRKSVNRK